MAKNDKNYLSTFLFPGIDVVYPVYVLSESGRACNFKSISYPSPKSRKRFTRYKQLSQRSLQAKIFDAICNIGYFNPLTVWPEFPIVIQNSLRIKGQTGMFYYLDYYFPDLRLAVELDSDLHNIKNDKIRDEYLRKIGITVYRIKDLHHVNVQKLEFPKLAKFMRERGTVGRINFDFLADIRVYNNNKIKK